LGEEDAKHLLLKFLKSKTWREIVSSKWCCEAQKLAFMGVLNCTNVTGIKKLVENIRFK
jgi:hypothetical protein